MTTVLLLVICLLSVFAFVQAGALVELFEQLKQVRAYINLHDAPTPLDLGKAEGVAASRVGLPGELDDCEQALVLFLSNKCETCFRLAASLAGGELPPRLWVVVVPVSGDASEFIETFQLKQKKVLIDEEEHVVSRLGLDITPAVIYVENGRLQRAETVPSVRQLYAALPNVMPRHSRLVPMSKSKHAIADVENSDAQL